MTDRKKSCMFLFGLLILLVLFFSRILFTDKIIRAPDIIAEFYWGAKGLSEQTFTQIFNFQLYAMWDPLANGGITNEGGNVSFFFLIPLKLIFYFFPLPANIAWNIVLHLFFGACGTYFCCRVAGASRFAALLGGAIFALAPENASLINAGHVMKIATLSYAPWAFYFLERGFQTRRVFFFLTTAFVLAFQFFNTHWQIAFYTCLCVGAYGVLRLIGTWVSEREERKKLLPRLLGMNVLLLVFFLTTVSISLLPLANWSKETNRGVQSGSNQSAGGGLKGGLDVDEAMSWSMPPEELGAFIIPGYFGLSRQEAGVNPTNIAAYYWGRMRFTQTVSYMGLLPWLLLPLPLIFRRDRYTWLSMGGIVGGILFSMGKYTPFYWMLYKFFPGINHFRVPKMMMFIPVLGLAILAARGIDLLRDEDVRRAKAFTRYLIGVCALPAVLLVMLAIEYAGAAYWMETFAEVLSQPTRYEQGAYLIGQRWGNIVRETAVAAGLSALIAVVMLSVKKQSLIKIVPYLLLALFVADTWRINDKFMFLTSAPEKKVEGEIPPLMKFLKSMPGTYRILPLDGSDPMQYASRQIPVMFTSNPVQLVRWQQFLEAFNLAGAMPDILNVKYFVMPMADYQQQKASFGNKLAPVFTTPDAVSVVLENRTALPKGWLVPSVMVSANPEQRLALLQNQMFDPLRLAIVESPPPFQMADPVAASVLAQRVDVTVYENERIVLDAAPASNALLVLGEKFYKGWQASVDGKRAEIVQVNHVLRGVYLTPGAHKVEFRFDPLPFKVGKYLTLASFFLFAVMLAREWLLCRKREQKCAGLDQLE
ncbi:MAG: YfhO family protein [Deltaproteobacteria bacterium]|nr:YfhO family protein [Deltaproteobacteria bacterium]